MYVAVCAYLLQHENHWLETYVQTARALGAVPPYSAPNVGLSKDARLVVYVMTAAYSILGPVILSITMATCRPRWWLGPVAGFLLGTIDGLAGMGLRLPTIATLTWMCWVLCGSYGGLLGWIRRRWRC